MKHSCHIEKRWTRPTTVRGASSLLVTLCSALMLAAIWVLAPPPAAAQDMPTTLIPDGVTDYTVVGPKLFWHTQPGCNPSAVVGAAAVGNEVIQRMPTYGGLTRQLYGVDVGTICQGRNLTIRSTIAADAEYVYWLNNGGVQRLSVEANVGDAPEPLNALPLGTGELIDAGDVLYAVAHDASTHVLWRVGKSGGAQPLAQVSADAKALSANDLYLFWLEGTNLRRLTLADSSVITIAGGVSSYFAEAPRTICIVGCVTVRRVLFGQGQQLREYDNDSGAITTLYTAGGPESGTARMRAMTSDEDHVYFLEQRSGVCAGGGPICYSVVLKRMPRGGGAATPTYTVGDLATALTLNELRTDGTFLYWIQDGALLRLPNNAAELPRVNVRLTRVEVTQTVQDEQNSVLLVENRRTFVRAHVASDGVPVSGVTAWLYGSWAGGSGGPLLPVNSVGTQITVQPSPALADVDQSFLFELPLSWTQKQDLVLRVEVNPNQVPLEPTYADNSGQVGPRNFEPSPRLELLLVAFSHELDDTVYVPRLKEDILKAVSYLRRTYPLSSVPGGPSDPTPGLRPSVLFHFDEDLGARVDRSHASCKADDASCAPRYTNNLLQQWRTDGKHDIEKDVSLYGMITNAAGDGERWVAGGALNAWVASGAVGPFISYGDSLAAHELGHSLGIFHPFKGSSEDTTPACKDTNRPEQGELDTLFPYDKQLIGPEDDSVAGFDIGDPDFGIARAVYPSSQWGDFMGYCAPDGRAWISDYNYECLYKDLSGLPANALGKNCFVPPTVASSAVFAPARSAAAAGYLMAFGAIDRAAGTARIEGIRRLNEIATEPSPSVGGYRLRQVDGNGALLDELSFAPQEATDGAELQPFFLVTDFVEGVRGVQIVRGADDAVLASLRVSANPPEVSDVTVDGAPTAAGGTITLRWQASDADGDALRFDVLYSVDGAATGVPLFTNLTGNQVEIDTSNLGGSPSAAFLVIAHDGAHIGQGQSPPFAVPTKPPAVEILTPEDGLRLRYGQPINFVGGATDLQGRDVTFVWKDADGMELGSGPVLALERPPVGEHQITLEARARLQVASATVTVFVEDALDLPGPKLSVGQRQVVWLADGTVRTAQLSIVNVGGGGNLTWKLEGAPDWLAVDPRSGTTPAVVTLTSAAAALSDGETQQAQLLIKTDKELGQSVAVDIVWTSQTLFSNTAAASGSTTYLPILHR